MHKKGDVGLGTLIVLIALLLATGVVIAVLLQQSEALSNDMTMTRQEGKRQISTQFEGIELVGHGPGVGEVSTLEFRAKLAPSSDRVELGKTILVLDTGSQTAELSYRGGDMIPEVNNSHGFNTYGSERIGSLRVYDQGYFNRSIWVINTGGPADPGTDDILLDLDGDGVNDSMQTCHVETPPTGNCPSPYNGTHVRFDLSTRNSWLYVPLRNNDGSLSVLESGAGGAFNISYQPIGGDGYLTGTRNSSANANAISYDDNWTYPFGVYLQPHQLEEDLDDDEANDYLAINETHLFVYMSSVFDAESFSNVSAALSYELGADLSNPPESVDFHQDIVVDGTTYAEIDIEGTSQTEDALDENVDITVTPVEYYGKGYYVVQKEDNTRDSEGVVKPGDVITFYLQSAEPIEQTSDATLRIITKGADPYELDFNTPNTITRQTVPLFP